MELKCGITLVLLLFLILARPNLTQGEPKSTEIYEIDYRGPETHSYIPPPRRSGGRPFVHHGNVMARPQFKGPTVHSVRGDGKPIHG